MLMDLFIILCLLLVALVLLLVDLFLIPGTGFASVLAAGCVVFAVYYAFDTLGMLAGLATLALAGIGGVLAVMRFMRSKTLDRVALKKNIDSTVDRTAAKSLRVGDKGKTVTRLALIGNADFDGKIVEVKSADGFMDAQTPVTVIRVSDSLIEVVRDKE